MFKETRGIITHNVVHMRAHASSSGELVSQALFGEIVRVVAEEGDHVEVQTPDQYRGWIRKAHLSTRTVPPGYPSPSRASIVSSMFVPLLASAREDAERVSLLTYGDLLETKEDPQHPASPFVPILMPNQKIAFALRSGLRELSAGAISRSHSDPVRTARTFLGVPYLWGGRSAFGLDCSGFVQKVYQLCGTVIPRDAYVQAAWDGFVAVDRSAIKPGDLVYFKGAHDPRKRGITHVGMAIGGGQFIHAKGDYGVVIMPLNTGQYANEFACARRLK